MHGSTLLIVDEVGLCDFNILWITVSKLSGLQSTVKMQS
jgi:hypothetical protein